MVTALISGVVKKRAGHSHERRVPELARMATPITAIIHSQLVVAISLSAYISGSNWGVRYRICRWE